MIESIITKIEYLTSRQLTSCANGDLVKRNLNFSPVRVTATFCHPFKISFKIKIKSRRRMAIFKPGKFSIINKNGIKSLVPPHPNPAKGGGLRRFSPSLDGRGSGGG